MTQEILVFLIFILAVYSIFRRFFPKKKQGIIINSPCSNCSSCKKHCD